MAIADGEYGIIRAAAGFASKWALLESTSCAHFLVSTRQRSRGWRRRSLCLRIVSAEFDEELQKGFEILFFVVFVLSWVFWNILRKTKKRKERVFSEELVSEWVSEFSVSWRGWDTSELRWITRPAANTRWNGPSTTFSEPTTLLSFSLSIQRVSMEINPSCGEKKAHVRRKRSSYPHFISVNLLFRIQLLLLFFFSCQFFLGNSCCKDPKSRNFTISCENRCIQICKFL